MMGRYIKIFWTKIISVSFYLIAFISAVTISVVFNAYLLSLYYYHYDHFLPIFISWYLLIKYDNIYKWYLYRYFHIEPVILKGKVMIVHLLITLLSYFLTTWNHSLQDVFHWIIKLVLLLLFIIIIIIVIICYYYYHDHYYFVIIITIIVMYYCYRLLLLLLILVKV